MVVLDISIVNVALPSIRDDLGFSIGGLQWVVNAYTITFGGLLLLGGRASDLLGRRRMFITGILVFALASFAGAIAPNAGAARRRARGTGRGRRDRRAEHARGADDNVPRGAGTAARTRGVGSDDGRWRERRRDPRRHPDRGRLALDLPRQRPRRHRDRVGGAAQPRARSDSSARGRRSQLRPARRTHRHHGPRRGRVRDRAHDDRGLGVCADARRARARSAAARRVRRHRVADRDAVRSYPCASSSRGS